MQRCLSISHFLRLLAILLSVLLPACTTVKHSLFEMAISYENWKAGLHKKTINWNDKPIVYLENESDSSKETIVMIHGYAANKEN